MLTYEKEILEMAETLKKVMNLLVEAFAENKVSYLTEAIDTEKKINILESAILGKAIADSKLKNKEEKDLIISSQIAETLERIGDECINLVERMEIKIEESLFFSDEAVSEYIEVLDAARKSFDMAADALKTGDSVLAERVIDNGFHAKELVERYRRTHNERLVKGECDPRSSNMFFDMLDYAGNIARHSSNVVKVLCP